MKNIAEVDKNFKVETNIGKEDAVFFDIQSEPFKIYGVFYEDGMFRRMPQKIADSVSEGVAYLNMNTAGGRVKFKTDSPYVAIVAKMHGVGQMSNFSMTGNAGFDLYFRRDGVEVYKSSFIPPVDMKDGYEGVIELGSSEMRDITINFPTYSGVYSLYIGVSDKSEILAADPYKIEKPVVYYGSSITQGGCAVRPGNSYQGFISRRFDCNYTNLGFSGNAKGEDEIAEYIKELDMSMFVYDYDYNAPTVEHLVATHEKMFKTIRTKNPNLPIIMLSRPKIYLSDEEKERRETVERTYLNAVEAGDKNVYYISGAELMKYTYNDGSVDSIHPNDLGFWSMANVLGDFIEKAALLKK